MDEASIPTYPDAAMNEQGVRFIDADGKEQFFPWHQIVIQSNGSRRVSAMLFDEHGDHIRIERVPAIPTIEWDKDSDPSPRAQAIQFRQGYLGSSTNAYQITLDVATALRNQKWHRWMSWTHILFGVCGFGIFFVFLSFDPGNTLDDDIKPKIQMLMLMLAAILYAVGILMSCLDWNAYPRRIIPYQTKAITQNGLRVIHPNKPEQQISWDELVLPSEVNKTILMKTHSGMEIALPESMLARSLILCMVQRPPAKLNIGLIFVFAILSVGFGPLSWGLAKFIIPGDPVPMRMVVQLSGIFVFLGFIVIASVLYLHWLTKLRESKSQ